MKTWSNELIARTHLELEEYLIFGEGENKRLWLIGPTTLVTEAHFKNIDGKRFGIMTARNVEESRYIISLKDSKEQEVFESVDALIKAGWVLD